jgi:hypothetical protein
MKKITQILLFIAIIMVWLGGITDWINRRVFYLSKEHFWFDGLFILLIAFLFQISN